MFRLALLASASTLAIACSGGDEQATSVACNDAPTAASGDSYIALQRDFRCFRGWQSFDLGTGAAAAGVHASGKRVAYVSKLPPKGSTTFPVGTVIVKVSSAERAATDWQVFAMVKRGGGFNDAGAAGWEWLELKIGEGDPAILWRGVGPPVGEGYAQGATCNECHGSAKKNDFVQSTPLTLDRL